MKIYQGMKLKVNQPFAHLNIGDVITVKAVDDYGMTYAIEKSNRIKMGRMSWKLFFNHLVKCCEIYDRDRRTDMVKEHNNLNEFDIFKNKNKNIEQEKRVHEEQEENCDNCEQYRFYQNHIDEIKETVFYDCRLFEKKLFDNAVLVIVRCPNGYVMTESYVFDNDEDFCEVEGIFKCLKKLEIKYNEYMKYNKAELDSILSSIRE